MCVCVCVCVCVSVCVHKYIERVCLVNWHYLKIFFLCMCSVCFRFCLLHSKLESLWHCLWEKQGHNAIHSSRNLEMSCCTTWLLHRKLQYVDFSLFSCQSENSAVDSKKVEWFQWWLRKYGCSEVSFDKKRSLKFVGEIQAVIDNDTSKSIAR